MLLQKRVLARSKSIWSVKKTGKEQWYGQPYLTLLAIIAEQFPVMKMLYVSFKGVVRAVLAFFSARTFDILT
jgi:hypothetical protein